MRTVLAIIAALALAGCATVQNTLPSWMPGSNAVSVKLSGGEEVPPAKTDAKGGGTFRLKEDGSLSGSVTTEGVAGTMAHIHHGAKGANGPVLVPLDKKGDTYSVAAGRKLTAEQMKLWNEGMLYVNVHSAKYKGGEVRGQITP